MRPNVVGATRNLLRGHVLQRPHYCPCLRLAIGFLEHFGNTEIVLGDYQKLVRGNIEKPMWGMPDVLTASHARPYKDGKVKVEQGESYIALARFSKTGLPEIETMISYGNSTNENSPHFADQMEPYLAKQPKKMTLDKEEILKNAVRNYHPK